MKIRKMILGDASLDSITTRYLLQDYFKGVAIRIEHHGQCIFEKVWGQALLTNSEKISMGEKSLFDLASLSKLFTSTAILRLMTMGTLQTSTPVLDFLECNNPVLKKNLTRVNIASLLNHTSGIHYWYPFYTRSNESFETLLSTILIEHPAQKKMIYSDLNFMLLGMVIEQLSEKSLPEAMDELVFSPLGFKSVCYNPEVSNTVATEYGNRIERHMVEKLGLNFTGWRNESIPVRGTCHDGNCYYYFNGAAGHAGIFSDATDVTRLGSLYMENGLTGSDGYFDSSLMKEAIHDSGNERGYGFQFGDKYPEKGFGHTGFTGTYLYINPVYGLSIAILANRLHVKKPLNIDNYRTDIIKRILHCF